MDLNERQKRHLRGLGHHLKPVVWVGQHGLTDAVLTEVGVALDAHELIKVKIAAGRDVRGEIADQICAQTAAVLVHSIGQMVVIFRRNAQRPKIALPSS